MKIKQLALSLACLFLAQISIAQTKISAPASSRIGPAFVGQDGIVRGYNMTLKQARQLTLKAAKDLNSFYCIDRGKQGYFELDSTDTTSPDDNSTVVVLFGSKRFRYTSQEGIYNVCRFGAIPNDGKDDSEAFRKGINFLKPGEVLFVGTGVYEIQKPLDISKHNFHLKGANLSQINFSPTTAQNGFVFSGFDIQIENIRFVSNEKVLTSVTLKGNGSRCSVRNCVFEGHSSRPTTQKGLVIDGSTPATYLTTVSDTKFMYFDVAFDLFGETNGNFYNLNFHHPRIGIRIATLGMLSSFSKMFFQTYQDYAIQCVKGGYSFSDLHFESNTGPGLRFENGSNFSYYANILQTGSQLAISDAGADNFGFGHNGPFALKYRLKPTYDIYVEPNCLFLDMGYANVLSFKKADGSIFRFWTP